jgi:hypothetical protein
VKLRSFGRFGKYQAVNRPRREETVQQSLFSGNTRIAIVLDVNRRSRTSILNLLSLEWNI